MSFAQSNRPGLPAPKPTSATAHLWMALGIGLLFAFFLFFARAPVPRVVGAGIVIALAAFALLRAMEVGRIEWPPPPRGRLGGFDRIQRWRLNGFDAAVDKVPGFSPHLRVRLADLATAILAGHDLQPGSPAAVTMLGPRTHDLLYPPPRDPGQGRLDDPIDDELLILIDRLIELSAEEHALNWRGES